MDWARPSRHAGRPGRARARPSCVTIERDGRPIGQLALWIGFDAFALLVLALGPGVFHRKAHVVRAREAAAWTAVWMNLASLFGAGVDRGAETALEHYAGYPVEQASSVDNIFVFVLIFSYVRAPRCTSTAQSSA